LAQVWRDLRGGVNHSGLAGEPELSTRVTLSVVASSLKLCGLLQDQPVDAGALRVRGECSPDRHRTNVRTAGGCWRVDRAAERRETQASALPMHPTEYARCGNEPGSSA